MGQFSQHAYTIPTPKKGEKAKIHRIKAGALHRGHELLDIVNQGGKIKLHALVDNNLPSGTIEILVVGTGNDIDDSLVNRIQKITSLVINDGQFGYHYYLVTPTEGGERGHSLLEVTITYDIRKGLPSDLEAILAQYQLELSDFYSEICFEGQEAVVMSFNDASVRHTDEFKQMRDNLYDHAMVTSIKIS